jgi:hypothetical protein
MIKHNAGGPGNHSKTCKVSQIKNKGDATIITLLITH